MKTMILSLLIALPAFMQAQIHILNNNHDRAPEHYETWGTVYAAASSGDTIYVVGSNQSYGSITISKPLTIIGPGYFLEDAPDSLKLNNHQSRFGLVTIGTLAPGTVLCGLQLDRTWVYTDNVLIKRCYVDFTLNAVVLYQSSDTSDINYVIDQFRIEQSYFSTISVGLRCDGCIIRNNLIGSIHGGGYSQYPIVIDHNTFGYLANNGSSWQGLNEVHNSVVSSNIFAQGNYTNYYADPLGNSFSHNVCSNSSIPAGLNNVLGVSCYDLFINSSACFQHYGNPRDWDFALASTSPALGVGEGGTDAGCTDGSAPYVFSGFPPIPRLTKFQTQGVSTSNSIDVEVKAVSQQ